MLGIWGGTLAHIILAIIGLSAVITASAWAFTVVKWGGVLYLLWLGVSMIRGGWRGGKTIPSVDPSIKTTILGDFRARLDHHFAEPQSRHLLFEFFAVIRCARGRASVGATCASWGVADRCCRAGGTIMGADW